MKAVILIQPLLVSIIDYMFNVALTIDDQEKHHAGGHCVSVGGSLMSISDLFVRTNQPLSNSELIQLGHPCSMPSTGEQLTLPPAVYANT